MAESRQFWRHGELWALIALVLGIYFTRIDALRVMNEETRWGRGAALMLETGDWLVLRQQRKVFPERPPMTSWAMAAVGEIRGGVDTVAVRLPSVISVLLTCIAIYVYSVRFLSRLGALAAATAYATFAQVMQIGSLGESEALFTLLLASSLFVWHAGYVGRWRGVLMWSLGYGLAGLAALVKGPQAPVYFVGVTTVWLLVRGDRRVLFSWAHAAGIAIGVGVVAAWQVPYLLAAGWSNTLATWTGLAADRFVWGGFLKHVATYPFETAGCLLPWVLLLPALLSRRLRAALGTTQPHVNFLLVALAVTYPTVWFATGARGRYFMPLYPCVAVLVGIIVDRCVHADAASAARAHWNRFLGALAWIAAAAGLVILAVSLWPGSEPRYAQEIGFAVVFALAGLGCAATLLWARRESGPARSRLAVLVIGAFLGLAYTGCAINYYQRSWHDPRAAIAAAKRKLPAPGKLVSLGPVHHTFCYFFGTTIEELPWPVQAGDLPPDVEYFCMDFSPGRPYQALGRGRTWRDAPKALPFRWEEIASICCERRVHPHSRRVVIGRVVRR